MAPPASGWAARVGRDAGGRHRAMAGDAAATQPRSSESQEGVYTASQGPRFGDGVLVDGVDRQAARRAYMRALTTARQAAERTPSPRLSRTPGAATVTVAQEEP